PCKKLSTLLARLWTQLSNPSPDWAAYTVARWWMARNSCDANLRHLGLDCSVRPEAQPVKDLRSIGTARRPGFRTLLAIVAAALAVLMVVVAVVEVRNFVQGIGQSAEKRATAVAPSSSSPFATLPVTKPRPATSR